MRRVLSLHLRLLAAFAIFGATLTLIYGVMAWRFVHVAEDAMIETLMDAELERVLGVWSTSHDVPRSSGLISCVTDHAQLPADLSALSAPLPEGAYEVKGRSGARWNLRVKTFTDQLRVYLYVNENDLEFSERVEGYIRFLIIGLSGLVALIGLGVGGLISRRVIAPLRRLTVAVSEHRPEEPPPNLRRLVSHDELGALAEHLEDAMERVASTARREQLFSHYASHELRSSLAVARGVSELLGDGPWYIGDPRLKRLCDRLDRALHEMSGTVEASLWLARSHASAPQAELVSVYSLCAEEIERLRPHVRSDVTLRVDLPVDLIWPAPRLALRMVVSNLLSNAIRHTSRGVITLRGDAEMMEVEDTGSGIPQEVLTRVMEPYVKGTGEGHGLGLAIVKGVCDRLGWEIYVEASVDVGTRVRISR